MADPITLTAVAPGSGLPLRHGAMTLTLRETGPVTSLAAVPTGQGALAEALTAQGLTLPEVGRMAASEAGTTLWFGRNLWLLMGVVAEADVTEAAATTDQSDAWTWLDLTGPVGAEVMARLVPVDLRDSSFPTGSVIRTTLHGMMVAVFRESGDVLTIGVFRSMSGTLVRTVAEAMETVAAI
ncbi:sarcosine oxidase subunit gamma [Pseudooceanicola sp. C21-150M6]|uniref:sarcosine oxidase subunit gamma n=1 Tax=Pseudooceanicola sp. C21-150M6 TaxID=3434355 RepID=UPI003D7F5E8B